MSSFFRKLNSKVQRSQSCSDTVQDRVKSRLRAAPPSRAKVHLSLRLLLGSLPLSPLSTHKAGYISTQRKNPTDR